MTEKQKAAFLRSEGWPYFQRSGLWVDPRSPGKAYGYVLPMAFRIASRRKAARERAELKRAGFEFSGAYWFSSPVSSIPLTRAEAIEKARGK